MSVWFRLEEGENGEAAGPGKTLPKLKNPTTLSIIREHGETTFNPLPPLSVCMNSQTPLYMYYIHNCGSLNSLCIVCSGSLNSLYIVCSGSLNSLYIVCSGSLTHLWELISTVGTCAHTHTHTHTHTLSLSLSLSLSL